MEMFTSANPAFAFKIINCTGSPRTHEVLLLHGHSSEQQKNLQQGDFLHSKNQFEIQT